MTIAITLLLGGLNEPDKEPSTKEAERNMHEASQIFSNLFGLQDLTEY
jgi:hypothetical protein